MKDPDGLAQAAAWLRSARRVVVFTGAGVSAESGIPTFRDKDGFWQRFPIDEFANWKGLQRVMARQPQRLAEFLYAVLHPLAVAEPNAGHLAIAALERHVPVTVITQNVDRLHQEAGSQVVHEVHGSLFDVVDRHGNVQRRLSRDDLRRIADQLDRARHRRTMLPRIVLALRPLAGLEREGSYYRPSIVLFGDAMAEPAWSDSLAAAGYCDCMIQVGTSATVMPAAMLPREAQAAGAKLIAIDPHRATAGLWLEGTAAGVLPKLLQCAFGTR